MSNLIETAKMFAIGAHRGTGQKRKYTGNYYDVHLSDVVRQVKRLDYYDDEMIAAAWLHDVVEDTEVTFYDLEQFFGVNVVSMVIGLTKKSKLEDGDRAIRKAIDDDYLLSVKPEIKNIKMCDIWSNSNDNLIDYDKDFAKKYLYEKIALLNRFNNDVDIRYRDELRDRIFSMLSRIN